MTFGPKIHGCIPATASGHKGLQIRREDPTLWVSMQMAVAVALSIVFTMTTKPSLTISVSSVLVSLALGALVGAMTLRPRPAEHSVAPHVREV